MFAPLPTTFPELESLVQAMDALVVNTPPPVEAIGKRLRQAYARARAHGYKWLSMGEIRKLPYAYWLPPEPALYEIDGALVKRYWGTEIQAAIDSGPRRTKRWLTPLFFTYCEAFLPANEAFRDFARRFAAILPKCEGAFAAHLNAMQKEVAFFTPSQVPSKLGRHLMNHPRPLEEAFESLLLWPGFVDTPLGEATFSDVLGFGPEQFSDRTVIERVIVWARRLGAPVSKSANRVAFADALLKPWVKRTPPDRVKSELAEFFVSVYGDPRLADNRQYQWKGVSSQALNVIMTWLAGDTLRVFMRVLEKTADDIWRYRQKFWMAYYDAGHIQEAWLALGAEAARYAKRMQADQLKLEYAKLEGPVAQNQSVLLLKIGGIVFTEWSHNGSLRAYEEDDANSPDLFFYRTTYHGAKLRDALSMDFHDGMNLNPELRHMHSAGGTWQRKARDFIRQHTGISLADKDILWK